MEADEEADIVIGDKRELLCDTVTEFTDMEIGMSCNELTFFASGKIWGIFNICSNTFKCTIWITKFWQKYEIRRIYPLLMTYVIKFSNVRRKYIVIIGWTKTNVGSVIWNFDNRFIKTEKNNIPIKINSKDGYIDKTFTTIHHIAMLAKIISETSNISSSSYANNCFVNYQHKQEFEYKRHVFLQMTSTN